MELGGARVLDALKNAVSEVKWLVRDASPHPRYRANKVSVILSHSEESSGTLLALSNWILRYAQNDNFACHGSI